MHAVSALVFGLIFLLSGLILKYLSANEKSRNPVAGYRTPRSMKSPETWVAANRYAAKAFFAAGAGILLIGAALWWKPLPKYNEFVILAMMFLSLVIIVLATESYLKRRFDEQGAPRTLSLGNTARSQSGRADSEGKAEKIPYTRLEWLLEALSILLFILVAILLIARWPQLPDQVPRHYNFRGVVDAWGGEAVTGGPSRHQRPPLSRFDPGERTRPFAFPQGHAAPLLDPEHGDDRLVESLHCGNLYLSDLEHCSDCSGPG